MKKISKIIIGVFVVTASLFFIAGQSIDFFVFKYRQSVIRKEIKKQIKAGVDESDLHTINVVDVFLYGSGWVKPGKEFKYKGQLFDVVRKEIINGQAVYKCINDTQEKQLFAELDELVRKRMKDDSGDEYLKNLLKDYVKYLPQNSNSLVVDFILITPSYTLKSFSSSYLFDFNAPPRFLA